MPIYLKARLTVQEMLAEWQIIKNMVKILLGVDGIRFSCDTEVNQLLIHNAQLTLHMRVVNM